MNDTAPEPMPGARPVAVVACAVLEDEVRHFARDLPQVGRLEFLEQGLHNEPLRLRAELQRAVDRLEAEREYAAIAFVYGLCSRGIEGLQGRRTPLVFPRAHDCITLLLGNRQRYDAYIREHPGTYWYSPGWNRCHVPPGPEREERARAEYAKKFDEDTVEYLMEEEGTGLKHYNRAVFVDLGAAPVEADLAYTRRCADYLGWAMAQVRGDPALLRALLGGPWPSEDFLVIPPGRTLRFTADEKIIDLA